jgi:ABC-2 type transport system ATP-binding protein
MIRVSHLTRRFGHAVAVDDVSFRLERGEVVGFLGPNGAGKTTIMRMLTGFLPATSGSIEVAGHDVFRESIEVRRRIGYLPESVPLYREHRVEEMLGFQARLHRIPSRETRARIGAVLERVGMADRRRSLIGTLSKGQRQRIGLAVALLPDPEVLVLDEPTSGLDPLQRIGVRDLVGELAAERTVLLSSHILPEVEAVCPRVIILHRGRIAADGTATELLARHGASFVRVEAALADPAAALRLLAALPGVERAQDRGPDGAHHRFDLEGGGPELCAEVGRLAQREGWSLCELSRHRPTLEGLFARIALDLGTDAAVERAPEDRAP